jgi:Circularly permutated YpsA SLOG family
MLERVISGGQTGADQAALRAARACGIPTGGWAPRSVRNPRSENPSISGWSLQGAPNPGKNTERRGSGGVLGVKQHVRYVDDYLLDCSAVSEGC